MGLRYLAFLLVSAPVAGCSSGIEAPPEGYHHERVNTGKRTEVITVPDDPPAQKPLRILVRADPDHPEPGDHYIFITEGKQVTRILVRSEEIRPESSSQWIEVSPDKTCPFCKPFYKVAGKQMIRSFYCDVNVHVKPVPRRDL